MKINIEKIDKIPFSDESVLSEHDLYIVIQSLKQNRRRSISSSKTRGQVNYSSAKSYKQKGTGRARRGSNRTPLRRGGGVIFGPQPRIVTRKINKSISKKILSSLIFYQKDNLYVVDSIDQFTNTKTAFSAFHKLVNTSSGLSLILDKSDLHLFKACKNLDMNVSFIDNFDTNKISNSQCLVLSSNLWEKVK